MFSKDDQIQVLETRIEEIFSRWNVPGVAVGIIKDGQLVSSRGYGVRDVKNPLPVDGHTNFAIGSNSKAFTAACVGMLVEEGKLGWDDP
ncbi:MAG: serine hydrolase domain-containing protein, partial [Anaerolineaceae bacterium]